MLEVAALKENDAAVGKEGCFEAEEVVPPELRLVFGTGAGGLEVVLDLFDEEKVLEVARLVPRMGGRAKLDLPDAAGFLTGGGGVGSFLPLFASLSSIGEVLEASLFLFVDRRSPLLSVCDGRTSLVRDSTASFSLALFK